MTLKHLTIFINVYQQSSITKAAQLLNMTQPAITRAIKELEQYYGILLFERLNRKLYITLTGQTLYTHAIHIIDSFNLMEQEIKNSDKMGILNVGTTISLGNFLLPNIILQFQKTYPNTKVHVNITNGDNLKKALLDNTLDLALIEGIINDDSLKANVFKHDNLLVIVAKNHPLLQLEKVYLHDLLKYDFLLREKGSVGRNYIDSLFAMRDIIINPLWESTSTHALIEAVAHNIGIAILPAALVDEALNKKQIAYIKLVDEPLERKNYIIYHKHKLVSETMQHFINITKQNS